jgi:hypothetical protein
MKGTLSWSLKGCNPRKCTFCVQVDNGEIVNEYNSGTTELKDLVSGYANYETRSRKQRAIQSLQKKASAEYRPAPAASAEVPRFVSACSTGK